MSCFADVRQLAKVYILKFSGEIMFIFKQLKTVGILFSFLLCLTEFL